MFDPHGKGAFIDINVLGHAEAIFQSAMLLADGSGPLFEAGLPASGALAYADVMLPDRSDGTLRWRMPHLQHLLREGGVAPCLAMAARALGVLLRYRGHRFKVRARTAEVPGFVFVLVDGDLINGEFPALDIEGISGR